MTSGAFPAIFGRRRPLWTMLLLFWASFGPESVIAQSYPETRRDTVIEDYHGNKVADPYRWLEGLEDPATGEWVKAQNALTSGYLGRLPDRDSIHRRLTALWNYARVDVPWREAGRIFYVRNSGLQQQPVLYVQNGLRDTPLPVLDPREISRGGAIEVRDFAVSPDGRLLAYSMSRGGADEGETNVREVATGRELADVVLGPWGPVCWTHDARGFFYMRPPDRKPGGQAGAAQIDKQVWYHSLGQPQSRDRLIHEWKDNYKWIYCMVSESGRHAIIVAERGSASEVHTIDLKDPKRPEVTAPPVRLLGDRTASYVPIGIVGDTLYLFTDLDAPRRRVIALDLTRGAEAHPRTIIAEASDVIEDAVISGGRLVVHYLMDVKSRLRLFSLGGRPAGEVVLPGVGSIGWPLNGRSTTSELFYSFRSFLTPTMVYRYDFRNGTSTPFRPPRVPFDSRGYETRQIFYTSKGGTRVPMFITAKKNLKLDGRNPTLLTGYGGYGATVTPSYQSDIPLWLEMGGVYAVANLRGGGEYGERWHREGMLERKQTSFDDFIAAAEYLVAERYTSPGKLAMYGHSNGGLLIGAVLTQRPDLFAAAVANAGHYDMLRYHKFTVGAGWIPEYGSSDDSSAFPYLLAYSPLHNVRAGACYPATLLLAADHDDRVLPSHAFKFAAELQAKQGCDRPILLRLATNASHSYAAKDVQLAELSDKWAFIAAQLGTRATTRDSRSGTEKPPRRD